MGGASQADAIGDLQAFLGELALDKPCKPPVLEPDVDDADKYADEGEREQQDLSRGLVKKATLEDGDGATSPTEGDLVLVHYTARLGAQQVVASSLVGQGGDGAPVAFLLGGGGRRVPRCWELSALQMTKGELCLVKTEASYGYEHPSCDLRRPSGLGPEDLVEFEIRLLQFYPKEECSAIAAQPGESGGDVFKRVIQEADSWETPREPFDVEFSCTARRPADSAELGQGEVLFTSERLVVTIGADQVGMNLEAAICSMPQGEKAILYCPADSGPTDSSWVVPALHDNAASVEYELEVLHIIQVRDLTGSGEVMKRRVKDGEGEFPIDCPLEDCAVRVHYTVSQEGKQLFDSRGDDGAVQPLELTLGAGSYPQGMEMAIRLMIPKEVSRVNSVASYAYQTPGLSPEAVPSGVDPSADVVWDIELFDFDKAPNWHQMEVLERITVVEDMKKAANALFSAQRYSHAKTKYEKAYKIVNHTFDAETDEEQLGIQKLKSALELNIAAVMHKNEDYTGAITWCNKVLEADPDSAKALYRRGNASLAMGNFEEAKVDFEQYARVAPEDAEHAKAMVTKAAKREEAADAKQRKQLRGFMG